MTELWRLSAGGLTDAYARGEATPAEALEACLERIERLDGRLGAFTHLAVDEARVDADRATAELRSGSPRSPLHGVPVAVKEVFEVAGWPHTAGSLAWAGRVGQADAVAVSRLREAGAVLVGLVRSHEFAWGATTQHERRGGTRNPWSHDRVPGGSSGGSGAAVASGMVPLALGSDTGGSVRMPAAFCATVGLRPTYGRLPVGGVVPLAPSFDCVGVLAREVGDAASALAVLEDDTGTGRSGHSLGGAGDLAGVRIGVPDGHDPTLGPDQARALAAAAEACAGLGAMLVSVRLPSGREVCEVFAELQAAEALALHRGPLGTWPAQGDLLGSDVRGRLEAAESAATADGAVGTEPAPVPTGLSEIREAVARLGVDLALSPVAACGPTSVTCPEGADGSFRALVVGCNALQSVAGVPSVSVPAGLDSDGLPVGVQLWGPAGRDDAVLSAAAVLRDALRARVPPFPS